MQGATADANAVAPKYDSLGIQIQLRSLISSLVADIKGRPLKVYKRGTIHAMVRPHEYPKARRSR
jgi:hypothetical protein